MPATTARASSADPAARPATATRTDQVLTERASPAGRDATVGGSGRLQAPARVHLLAARVYWGAAHPAYPSTRRATRDLRATASYYDRISRGHETVRFTLTRWVHVNATADTMCNRLSAAARLTSAALTRAGYHPGHFNRLMIFTEQCNAAVSAAEQPGRLSWIRYRNPGPATLIHELGHNLGLGHAYGLVCTDAGRRVSFGGTCHSVEYGDSWDAMGHSRASFSVPVLQRLGWAAHVATARADGSFRIADVEHPGSNLQAVRIPVGHATYWVEYQPEHLTQVGRSTAGVTIRRQVGDGRVQILDAAPGNPTALPFPDADLTNAALPVGSSFTTPENVRITTVATGRRATVHVGFGRTAAVPAAPVVDYAAQLDGDRYRVHWQTPADNGQVVLGYRVTVLASGRSVYLRSTAGARTSLVLPGDAAAGQTPGFTVEALNQVGFSGATRVSGQAFGPQVTVTSPTQEAHVRAGFDVTVTARPDSVTGSAPVKAWAELDGATCGAAQGHGPYSLRCTQSGSRRETVTVHVANANGVVTDVSVPVRLTGPA